MKAVDSENVPVADQSTEYAEEAHSHIKLVNDLELKTGRAWALKETLRSFREWWRTSEWSLP